MANEKNLVQNKQRTPRERRESARKAGKASGEVRRMKADFKAVLMERLEQGDTMQQLADSAIEKAHEDLGWWQAVRDTIGQRPVERRESAVQVNSLDKEQRDAAVQAALLGLTE